jgi:hypothetical protein
MHHISKVFFVLLTINISCAKSKLVEINTPTYEPKLVVNAQLAKDSSLVVYIHKTLPILVSLNAYDTGYSKATIVLFEDGNFMDSLKWDTANKYYYSPLHKKISATKKYSIKVSAKDITELSATSITPNICTIDTLIYSKNPNPSYTSNDDIFIRFKDDPNEKNYYTVFLSIPEIYPDPPNSSNYILDYYKDSPYSNDPTLEYINYIDNSSRNSYFNIFSTRRTVGIFFNDASFNGSEKELHFFYRSYDLLGKGLSPNSLSYPKFHLAKINKEFYDYLKLVRTQSVTVNNPFLQPAVFQSNIIGGYGLFTTYTEDVKEIK